MTDHRLLTTTAAVLTALLLAGCGGGEGGVREPLSLSVFFTGDAKGRIEPCGCFTGQLGGLTRVRTRIDSEKGAHNLIVDIGDAIAGQADYDVILHRYMLEAFAKTGYDAVNAGHREAALGVDTLRSLRASSPVPVLSANLLDAVSGEPVWDPYVVVEKGDYKIGIIGVVDDRSLPALGEGLVCNRMSVEVGNVLPVVREQVDAVVLLAFTDQEGMEALAKEFYEVDLILGGKVQQPAAEAKRVNSSIIAYTTNEARALGVLRAELAPGKAIRETAYDMQLMYDGISQDEELVALVGKYRDEIRETPLAVDAGEGVGANLVPGVKPAASYVGSEHCAGCHATAFAKWAKSGHAQAFAALKKRDSEANPKCIGCHVVGFGKPGGYRRAFKGSKMINVGCESCHGPGSVHVSERQSGSKALFTYRPLGAGDCKSCHYGEFSRPFNWDRAWPMIAHGKEGEAQ